MYSQARSVNVGTWLPWLLVAAVAVTALLTAFLNPSRAASTQAPARASRPTLFQFAQDKSRKSACTAHHALFWPPLLVNHRRSCPSLDLPTS
jgi:predicted lipoprotein with Yx(FWY)xxD motif